jgi:two-component system sensor histidine kinase/response regulator
MGDAGRATVLVIDDNAANRELAQATLEEEGFVVELAASGEAGIAAFARARPDCVLMDIRMPGMDGITACARLRELPGGAEVPIVFVTAQREVDAFDRARAAGGDDFITKPYRPSELVTRVTAATKSRRLAAERDELYDLIRQQRDDLMRLQLHKEQLVAFLVHDLKNPVHAIDLQGERIVRDPGGTPRTRDAGAKIQIESRALMRMLTNLLDLSKADEEGLRPQKQPIDLDPLLAIVVGEMQPRAQASQVEIPMVSTQLQLTGDPDLVRRILENLVDNAIRYAPAESAISISAGKLDGGIEVRIADAGAGVPPALREQVFERFVQLENTARSGRGLGLAFCKAAVEAHGGRIWIEDATPGAMFCVRFPDV